MTKVRTYITPSSIGSYFGVGFVSPEEQILIDLGETEQEFDEASEARMLLGRVFEDPSLNYFEEALHIKIDERNIDTFDFYEGKIKGKIDGMTMLDGVKTVVENKISNAQYGKFTDNVGYMLQCQSYMLGKDVTQCLLCGLYQGKPIYKIIKRDEAVITDIKRVADFVVDVLMGLDIFDNFPKDILAKYSNVKLLPRIENVSDEVIAEAKKLLEYKKQVKELEEKIGVIEDLIKDNFETGTFDNAAIKISVGEGSRAGGYDIDYMSLEHPEINYERYRKPNSTYRTLRVTGKKAK